MGKQIEKALMRTGLYKNRKAAEREAIRLLVAYNHEDKSTIKYVNSLIK